MKAPTAASTPDCFGVAAEFHMFREKCENCHVLDRCGAIVKVLVQAFENGKVSGEAELTLSMSGYRDAITYWEKYSIKEMDAQSLADHATFLKGVERLSQAQLEKLAKLAIKGAAKRQSERIARDIAKKAEEEAIHALKVAEAVEAAKELDLEFEDFLKKTGGIEMSPDSVLSKALEREDSVAADLVSLPEPDSEVVVTIAVASPLPAATVVSVAGAGTGGAKSAGPYKFPLPNTRKYELETNEWLKNELQRLVLHAFHGGASSGYLSIREEFCAIHIEMNHRRQLAPKFRPGHALKHKTANAEDIAESRDRQVIDIHWRAHSKAKPKIDIADYATIFDKDPFDLGTAERFAKEKWTVENKVSTLLLTDEMQWEHAYFHSTEIRTAWTRISSGDVRGGVVNRRGKPHIEKRLRDWINQNNRPQLAQHVPGLVEAWCAREIAGDAPAKVARMIALQTGKPERDRKAVAKTLKSLDEKLK